MQAIGLLLTFLPLFLILLLANWAERQRRPGGEGAGGLALLAYLVVGSLYGMLAAAGLAIAVGGEDLLALAAAGGQAEPPDIASLDLLGLGLWLPSLLGLLLLAPPVRRLAARVTALDADNVVHACALSLSMLVVINLMLTLAVGLPNLTAMLQAQEEAGLAPATAGVLWLQQLLTALLAMVGVGWLTRRTGGETLARLGLVRPSGRQLRIGLGVGLALVPLSMALEAVSRLGPFGVSPDVEALTEELLGPLFRSPLGILTLGLAAALGEEALFRGAMQPRFGLVLTALLFALVHSNYGVTLSTLIVFVLGLVLGRVRERTNTTTAMVVHAVYNISLGVLAYLSLSMLGE